LKRAIQKFIEDPMAEEIINQAWRKATRSWLA
jgi:ATP-dependent Clp protease ATP-binding subunit ClpA